MTTADTVLRYLRDMNRPFNAVNVADALASQGVKKSQVQNALDSLASAGKVCCVENGKQKIYLALQDYVEQTAEEKAAEDEDMRNLQTQIEDDTKRANAAQQELKSLQSALSLEEAKAQLAKLAPELVDAEKRLAQLKSGAVLVSAEDREKADNALVLLVNEWGRRKRIFNDIFDMVLDSSDKKAADLREEIGAEDDASIVPPADLPAAKALAQQAMRQRQEAKRAKAAPGGAAAAGAAR